MKSLNVAFRTLVSSAVVFAITLSSPAIAVDVASKESLMLDRMSHEVKRLRQDLALMQKEFYKDQTSKSFVQSNRPRGDISSQVEVQLSEMEKQLRVMNGSIEEAQHNITTMQKTLDKALNDIAPRLAALEQAKTANTQTMVRNFDENGNNPDAPVDLSLKPKTKPDVAKATEAEQPKENADEEAFHQAKKLLEQAQYEAAAIKFQTFITTFSDSKFVPEAFYWQGELFSIRQQDENAAVSFLKAYQTEPTGEKAGDSLLRLGGVLANMGKAKEACTTFDKAEKEFPKLADLKKQLTDERQRVGC